MEIERVTDEDQAHIRSAIGPIVPVDNPLVEDVQIAPPPPDLSAWIFTLEWITCRNAPFQIHWLPMPWCGLWIGRDPDKGRCHLYVYSSTRRLQQVATGSHPRGMGFKSVVTQFPRLFGRPASALHGMVRLSEFPCRLQSKAGRIEELLEAADDDYQRMAILTNLARNQMRLSDDSGDIPPSLKYLIHSREPLECAADIPRLLMVGERQAQRITQQFLGMSPKRYVRYRRFSATLQAILDDPDAPLAEIAHAMGFADQSHLTREIRLFSGFSPQQLFRQPGALISLRHGVLVRQDPSRK